jgi:hypothetical protein
VRCAGAVLRMTSRERRVAVSTRRDSARDDALAFLVTRDGRAELFDDPYGLMSIVRLCAPDIRP